MNRTEKRELKGGVHLKMIWDKTVKTCAAGAGALLSWWAGLGVMPQTLAMFMAADYATGLLCAWRGVSNKTQSGTVSSKAGFDGLLRKACIVLVVLIASQLDAAMNTQVMAGATMCFYMANEGISILENTALLGVPWPESMKRALEALEGRSDRVQE